MADRLNDYLASEAADYLDELDDLLSSSGPPDSDRFLQLATGIRGSTQMAGADSIARLASRIESAARSFAASELSWSEEIRITVKRTVDDLASLIGAIDKWGPEEERWVQRSLDRWEETLSGSSTPSQMTVPIASLFFDDAGPHILSRASAKPAITAVPIEMLLFSGEAALREALTLRPRFDAMARGDAVRGQQTAALVAELFDLLDLGLRPEIPEV
jgi:hypothetical protein